MLGMAGEMRLICPNCDAEYEVDATLIPEVGRDVQCSNCGHAWFQASPLVEAEVAAEDALFSPGGGVAAEAVAAAANDDHDDTTAFPVAGAAMSASGAAPATRNIDASVLSVLREEAEREAKARAMELPSMETQTEMGLQSGASGSDASVKSRITRMKGEAEAHSDAAESSPKAAAKREMLPKIETINSTLRATSEKRPGDGAAVAETMGSAEKRANGFGRGFAFAVLLIVVALMVYILAPKLTKMLPALADPLVAYVVFVDGLRLTVDQLLQGVTARIASWSGKTS